MDATADLAKYKVAVATVSVLKANVTAVKMAYASKDANALNAVAKMVVNSRSNNLEHIVLHNLMYFDCRLKGKDILCPLLRYSPPLLLCCNLHPL